MDSNPLLDALRKNLAENNADPAAFDEHETARNQHARPFDHPANVYHPPQTLNEDGSLKEAAGQSKPVQESADAGDRWLNVPDDIIDDLMAGG